MRILKMLFTLKAEKPCIGNQITVSSTIIFRNEKINDILRTVNTSSEMFDDTYRLIDVREALLGCGDDMVAVEDGVCASLFSIKAALFTSCMCTSST